MPNLTKKKRAKLFSGFGPFSSLAAKIDVSFAMALIDKSLANDLHTLRDIRNAFAHPKEELNFSSKRIVELIRNFSK
jgi:DNA-binding MltR family transcriptional regulator